MESIYFIWKCRSSKTASRYAQKMTPYNDNLYIDHIIDEAWTMLTVSPAESLHLTHQRIDVLGIWRWGPSLKPRECRRPFIDIFPPVYSDLDW